MTTLTSSSTITVGDGAVVTETAAIPILPALGSSAGTGRLVHPTLGTYDYDLAPTQYSNLHGDALIAPIWASSMTLGGAANTLWQGKLRDVVVQETWSGGDLSMRTPQFERLLSFWQNPPDPAVSAVLWYPNYASALGFKVALIGLTVGGQGITIDAGWVASGFIVQPVVLTLRVLDRV